MTAANHALTGVLVAVILKQPYVAIPAAFVSHFICDALPHFDSGFTFGKRSMYIYLLFDGGAALLFMVAVLMYGVENPILVITSALVAMVPDVTWLYYGVQGNLNIYKKYGKFTYFHHKIQWSASKWGIIPEVAWAGGMLTLILKLQ